MSIHPTPLSICLRKCHSVSTVLRSLKSYSSSNFQYSQKLCMLVFCWGPTKDSRAVSVNRCWLCNLCTGPIVMYRNNFFQTEMLLLFDSCRQLLHKARNGQLGKLFWSVCYGAFWKFIIFFHMYVYNYRWNYFCPSLLCLLLLICVSWTVIGQPWNSVFICRV